MIFRFILGIFILPIFVLNTYGQGFQLPWNNGVSYFVSRYGNPAPTGGNGSTCYSNLYNFTPHNYVAIDFDSPNGVYDPVRAVKAGTVIFAGWNGTQTTGYGKLVKILHADNTITYYAHNSDIFVSEQDYVEQGCLIADGGTTGNSSGDHIHFEWRDVGDVAFSDHRYPDFLECGCKVKAAYCYESNNSNGVCGIPCAPSNDDCSSATTLISNGAFANGTVECATASYGANQCVGCSCSSPDDLDVYYKFVAQETSHTVEIYDYASNFDGVIELRSGCGLGTNIGCYDPSGAPSSVSKTWSGLTIGQTYYIRVYEYNNIGTPPNSPNFKIKVTHQCALPDDVNSISGNMNVCKFETETYSVVPVSGATSYTWILPSGWTGNSTGTTIDLTVGNTSEVVKVKANNSCGSSTLETLFINVIDVPETPSTIIGSSMTCSSSVEEHYSVNPLTTVNNYTWTLPNGWTGSSVSNTISTISGTNGGILTVNATNDCGVSAESSLTIDVVDIDRTISIDNSKLISNALNANYQWIDCSTMLPITGENLQAFTPSENGSYAVEISKDGCVDTSNCVNLTNLGLSYFDKSIRISAFPNPTRDMITLKASGLGSGDCVVKFINTQGQVLRERELKLFDGELDTQLDISKLPSGFYFLNMNTKGFSHVFRIEKL